VVSERVNLSSSLVLVLITSLWVGIVGHRGSEEKTFKGQSVLPAHSEDVCILVQYISAK
jgi:hypothetical protein